MSLAPVIGKYVIFFTSLSTSVGSSLIYTLGGKSIGGGGRQITVTNNSGHSASLQVKEQGERGESVDAGKVSLVGNSLEESREGENSAQKGEVFPQQVDNQAQNEVKEIKEAVEKLSSEAKGEESKKLSDEQVKEFLEPFLKTLETPLYYRGYLNFINKVRMTLPKDTIEKPTNYWEHESKDDGIDTFTFLANKDKEYPKVMAYTQVQETTKFKELADQARKWFKDWTKGKENTSEEYYDFYYEIKKGVNKNEVIFWKYHKDKWYSFELEHVFDENYSGPILQVGYVWYKDTNWYGGAYYQAEGGRGYQRHIGAVGSSWYGNKEASINKDFVETFNGNDLSKFSKWWKILSECSKEEYCKKTLEIPQQIPDYVGLPLNHYLSKERDKWYDNYHPLQMKFNDALKDHKFDASKFKHIDTIKGLQR